FEFYRIADLNRVWILADVYRDQLQFIRRGASARITTAESSRALPATVSPSEPIFDEAALTLKGRLEAATPRWGLKPGHRASCGRMRSWARGCAKRCSSPAATGISSRGWSRPGGGWATTSR